MHERLETRRRFTAALAVLSMAILCAACGDDPAPQSEPDPDCTAGMLGCECDQNTCAEEGVECISGSCAVPSCDIGDLDCACYANGTCNAADDGAAMYCDGGSCRRVDDCVGSVGCACETGDDCDDDLDCVDTSGSELCQLPGCDLGEEDCGCRPDLSCDGDLACVAGLCEPVECPAGSEGCACASGGACESGLMCDGDNRCQPIGCTAGSYGCECDEGECAGDDAYCDTDDRCQVENCDEGDEGCACHEDETCDATGAGVLACDGGICVSDDCSRGQSGCACRDDRSCLVGSDECRDGLCRPEGCTAGQLDCECAGGSCETGLACRNGTICVDATGFTGGPCFDNGLCNRGNRCQDDRCLPCLLGTQGCGCDDADECNNPLSCEAGLCIDPVGLALTTPVDPQCYTPCTSDVPIDGGVITCPSDGLMPGCFGDTTCDTGQCVRDGGTKTECTFDYECPEHQACLSGSCMSNCSSNADCAVGIQCYRMACRAPCLAEGADCPDGSYCSTSDGVAGYCLPTVPGGAVDGPPADATFTIVRDDGCGFQGTGEEGARSEVSTTPCVVSLTNTNVIDSFRVRNDSPNIQRYTISKRRHRVYDDAGRSTSVETVPGEECEAADCPLFFLQMGEGSGRAAVQEFQVSVDPGAEALITVGPADASAWARWSGQLEVAHATDGVQTVDLTYSERPEGRWSGQIYYFGNFEDEGLDEWIAGDFSIALVDDIKNAFLQTWARFRADGGFVSLDEMEAVIASTRTESWRDPVLQERCGAGRVCVPFNNFDGFLEYTSEPDEVLVPTGVVGLPMSINVRPASAEELGEDRCRDSDHCYVGRIESRDTLQYAGDPAVSITFADDPAGCSTTGLGGCVLTLDSFDSQVFVGGRFPTDSGDTGCDGADDFELAPTPWLIPGFVGATELWAAGEGETARRYNFECRESGIPLTDGDADSEALNISLAGANPIPDGRTRHRTIELVDGAIVNSNTMVAIVRERTASFLGDGEPDLVAYGIVVLNREGAQVDAADYEGQEPIELGVEDNRLAEVGCSDALLDQIAVAGSLADNADLIANAVISGLAVPVSEADTLQAVQGDETVHYYCEDTGLIDEGPSGVGVPCPIGSRVTFFTLMGVNQSHIDTLDCQYDADYELVRACLDGECSQDDVWTVDVIQPGSCQEVVNQWQIDGAYDIRMDPVFRCADSDRLYCSDDRADLRAGKIFYESAEVDAVFRSIYADVDDAFRYKTRFRSRDGVNVGFVPDICVPDSDAVPYCYSPVGIEDIQERVDCAIELYTHHTADLDADSMDLLVDFLTSNFSYTLEANDFDQEELRHGFEYLSAELLIMLGDDAYAAALGSRFDLAGVNQASFEGSRFEPDGINLSGAVGFEMVNLYRAAQYYDLVLERFFALSPALAASVAAEEEGFITQAAVVTYFDRLVRASAQKARAWSEVATRYQNLNRPDISRRVIERAYTAAYLESVVLMHMMTRVVEDVAPEDRDQIVRQIELGQRIYRVALNQMAGIYEATTDGINYFGYPATFIPFPALEFGRDSAFEVAIGRAQQRASVAHEAEQLAISSARTFDTDEAAFQNELARIRVNYEAQLSEICGTFTVDEDGEERVYPAIPKYAYLSERARTFGNPCGQMGTGQIHQSRGAVDLEINDLLRIRTQMDNVLEEARLEEERWNAACDDINMFATTEYDAQGDIDNVEDQIAHDRAIVADLDRAANIAGVGAQMSGLNWGSSVAIGTMTGLTATAGVMEVLITEDEERVRNLTQDLVKLRTEQQCDLVAIDGHARVLTILLRLAELRVEAMRGLIELSQAFAQLNQHINQSQRLIDEQDEMEGLAINVEAARNNPNIRIYRNDAIINADRTFYSAIREAYAATRVLEYYTSQSYADLDQLFLIRTITVGDPNLQNYLIGLEDEFRQFEDTYGLPDLRVARISLRDEILDIPRINTFGEALGSDERAEMLRERLSDPGLLDENGYINIPFNTRLGQLSPLTRNHKIRYVTADFVGGDMGDTIGRVYLRMAGTSTVSSVDDSLIYFALPSRTAVINTSFNNKTDVYPAEVYRTNRLVDRPFINSRWELILNFRDEEVNLDIPVSAITDVRLFIYYSDFTSF